MMETFSEFLETHYGIIGQRAGSRLDSYVIDLLRTDPEKTQRLIDLYNTMRQDFNKQPMSYDMSTEEKAQMAWAGLGQRDKENFQASG